MFSGIRVVQLVAAKRNRIPAPQDIVHIGVLAVNIETLRGGFRGNPVYKLQGQPLRLLPLLLKIGAVPLLRQELFQIRLLFHAPDYFI